MPIGYFISDRFAFQIQYYDLDTVKTNDKNVKSLQSLQSSQNGLAQGVFVSNDGSRIYIKPELKTPSNPQYKTRLIQFISRPKNISIETWKTGDVFPYQILSNCSPDYLVLCKDEDGNSVSVPPRALVRFSLECIYVGIFGSPSSRYLDAIETKTKKEKWYLLWLNWFKKRRNDIEY